MLGEDFEVWIEEPIARGSHAMTSVHNFLIVYGGLDMHSGIVYNELCIYNTINDTWDLNLAPSHTDYRVVSSAICAVGNLIYIFGGAHPIVSQETNSLISFDLSSGSWKTLSSHTNEYDTNAPLPMYDSCIFYHNESLYILGGFSNDTFLNTMFKFCLKTSKWTLVPQNGHKLRSKKRIFVTIFKNKLYCFGGYLENETDRLKHVNIFDFSKNVWITRETHSKNEEFPLHRNYQSFVFSSTFGYLSGGEDQQEYYHGIWKIDLESLEWFKLDYSLRCGRYKHNMAVIEDSILYVFGGKCAHRICRDKLERCTVQPPKLYRLCLETIGRSPNQRSISKPLPQSIVDELNQPPPPLSLS
ncbi:Nitrile-specifier protein 5 [Thelohanellus kitauei]|uniref:Nitrile-specifier protein 5 n=1 Tax=Thelohanellus kitauei TaxID=669202 RepID=A0A0C2MJC6_THEKT|nr:Nitrile-specifier protein 5 [Thelohanellus kitauei]